MNTIRNKRLLQTGIITTLLFVCLFSCTERMDISTEASAPRLVIYGYLTSEKKQHSIKITRSSGYFVSTKPEGISNATVTISGKDETFILSETDYESGLYLTERDVAGKEGETYTLNVSLDFDEDGRPEEYEATSWLPYPPRADSIDFRPSELLDKYLEVLFWGRFPEGAEENYLSIHLYRNSRLINDSLSGFVIYDDKYIDAKEVEAVPCFYLDQDEDEEKLKYGDRITMRIDAITKEYATFITNAQRELWGSDPIFSGPPANIETNIKSKDPSNGILISGFFTAFSGCETSKYYLGE